MSTTHTTDAATPSNAANTTTKDELLSRAKAAIEAGERSMHDAAEALAVAQELHGASQAEMARAIGKSEAWVSLFLQWRRSGYKDDSPFGPSTKAGRLKHAKDRAASGASTPRKSRKVVTEPKGDADNAEASAERRRAEYAKQEVDAETSASTDAKASTSTNAKGSVRALKEFKYAVDEWLPRMDDPAKREATAYFLKKAGVAVS